MHGSPMGEEIAEIVWVDSGVDGDGNRNDMVWRNGHTKRDNWKVKGIRGLGRNLVQGNFPGVYKDDNS